MKLSKFAKELQAKGFTVGFTYNNEESLEIDGQFSEQSDIDYIKSQLNDGIESAWFMANVSLEFEGLTSEDYLGGCSYASFDDFTGEDDGYFDDMLHVCLTDIQEKAKKIIESFPK